MLPDPVDLAENLLGHRGPVHRIKMDPVHPTGEQIDDLFCGVGDARLLQRFGIVLVTVQNPPELRGDTGPAKASNPLDLLLLRTGMIPAATGTLICIFSSFSRKA